ncbi:MAG: aspartyl protease family protein [Alistipes sp.]|nr:aspartyl protease family protein [Alistipes sp.]
MKNFIQLVVAILFVATACSNTNQKTVAQAEPQLPEGAVEMRYERHLHFDVLLRDSIPARMIFDTGSSNLLLDSTFYAKTFGKNNSLRRAMLSGAGSGFQLTTLDASRWSYRVGELSHTEPMAVVMDLRKIVGDGVDGLFGLPSMVGKRVELNYAGGYIRILKPEEKITEDFTAIQCSWLKDKDRIIVPITITLADGYTLTGNFLVDTGMPSELALNSAATASLKSGGHLVGASSTTVEVGGVGGSRTESYVTAKQITIGGKALSDIRISCSENRQGAMADSRFDGLVGNALLAHFDVVFDLENWVMYIRPNAE